MLMLEELPSSVADAQPVDGPVSQSVNLDPNVQVRAEKVLDKIVTEGENYYVSGDRPSRGDTELFRLKTKIENAAEMAGRDDPEAFELDPEAFKANRDWLADREKRVLQHAVRVEAELTVATPVGNKARRPHRGQRTPIIDLSDGDAVSGFRVYGSATAAGASVGRVPDNVIQSIRRNGICAGHRFAYLHESEGRLVKNPEGTTRFIPGERPNPPSPAPAPTARPVSSDEVFTRRVSRVAALASKVRYEGPPRYQSNMPIVDLSAGNEVDGYRVYNSCADAAIAVGAMPQMVYNAIKRGQRVNKHWIKHVHDVPGEIRKHADGRQFLLPTNPVVFPDWDRPQNVTGRGSWGVRVVDLDDIDPTTGRPRIYPNLSAAATALRRTRAALSKALLRGQACGGHRLRRFVAGDADPLEVPSPSMQPMPESIPA